MSQRDYMPSQSPQFVNALTLMATPRGTMMTTSWSSWTRPMSSISYFPINNKTMGCKIVCEYPKNERRRRRISSKLLMWMTPPLLLLSALSQTATASSPSRPPTSKSVPTLVTGFGSHSKQQPSSRRKSVADRGRHAPLVLWEASNDFQSKSTQSFSVMSRTDNTTIEILPGPHVRPSAGPGWLEQAYSMEASGATMMPVEGLWGVVDIPTGGQVWIWVVSSEPIYTALAPVWAIRRVSRLHLVHVVAPHQFVRPEQRRQVKLLRRALQTHEWYFCDASQSQLVPDMTRRWQECGAVTAAASKSLWWWQQPPEEEEENQRPDSRFFWNEAMVKTLEDQSETDDNPCYRQLLEHVIPVTSAYCGVQSDLTLEQNNEPNSTTTFTYDQLIISRRSRFRAGTRFTARGADDTGAVANYVETEQVVVGKCGPTTHIASHVQTRGSIPLRWSSPTDIKTYRPRVRIGTDPITQARALQLHLQDETTRYVSNDVDVHPGLLFVNLVDKKSDQGRLGRAFDAVLSSVLDVYKENPDPQFPSLRRDSVKHVWFDFHALVKAGRWDRLSGLLDQVSPILSQQNYFAATLDNGTEFSLEVSREQAGVVRTNCMDCLDRTNVVQSIFGRRILFDQLQGWTTAEMPASFKQSMSLNPMTLPWTSGESSHRELWADNADAMSRLYAGTAALKGDFTRTGKRTKLGALDDGMNSLQRYYLNNFVDADRQEGMDLLTGFLPFSDADESHQKPSLTDQDKDQGRRVSSMSIKEATRQAVLGINAPTSVNSDPAVSYGGDSNDPKHYERSLGRRQVGLRWLPGDLRTQVQGVLFESTHASLWKSGMSDPATSQQPTKALESVDFRTATNFLPWWVLAEKDLLVTGSPGEEESVFNKAGYILGALIAGCHSPVTISLLVVGLASFVVYTKRQSDDNDAREQLPP